MNFILFFLFFLSSSVCQQIYPMTNCLGFLLEETLCTTTPCQDPRCLTCSSSTVDCLLCSSGYHITRSKGIGFCILSCNHSQIQTNHYNISSEVALINTDDICLDPIISNCTDPNCLSCSKGYPEDCLVCEKGMFPRFYTSWNITKCINCSIAMINCLECEWSDYCTQCKLTSDVSFGYILKENGQSCTKCEDKVTECIKCDGKNKCLECGLGNYLFDDGNHGICSDCLSYCDVCTNNTICTKCIKSYYLYSDTECQSCSAYLKNCNACGNNQTCDQCESGYYLVNPQTCDTCSSIANGLGLSCNGTHCTLCVDNSTLDITSKLCSPCNATPNCNACDGLTCTNCTEGYFLSHDKRECIDCLEISGCSECDGKVCVRCETGYYRSFSELKQIYDCFECSNINSSEACDGMNLVKCQDNFLLTDSLTCDPCEKFPYCKKCDGINCVLCEDGYYLIRNSTDWSAKSCISCSDNDAGILQCESCWNENYCKKCQNGYMLDTNFQCQLCNNERNCLTCDGYTCTSCFSGYYLTSENSCTECSEMNCLSCPYNVDLKQSQCSICQNGYYLHPIHFSCISCKKNNRGLNCAICEYNITINQTNSNYQLNCLSCDVDFGIIKQHNTCIACTLPNCQTCYFDSSTQVRFCSKCFLGYYLEPNGLCLSCGLNKCLTCQSTNISIVPRIFTCTLCSDGYFLNSTNHCQDCSEFITGCTSCSLTNNQLICNQCQPSLYYFNDNSCLACNMSIDSCKTCLVNSPQILCTGCHESYFLRSPLSCDKCLVPQCAYCSPKDVGKSCYQCEYGFYLLNSRTCKNCSLDVENCLECRLNNLNSFECNKCGVGYYIDKNNSVCSACPENCDNCLNETHCTSCSNSYYKQITSDGYFCISKSCESNFNVKDSINLTCTSCSTLYPNCSSCDYNQCITCLSESNYLMLPNKTFCSPCNGSIFKKIDDGSSIFCAYAPSIQNIQRSYSITSGLSKLNLACGAPLIMRVYMTYFIYDPLGKESIDFETVYENLKNHTSNVTYYYRDPNDFYWTVYLTAQTNTKGDLTLVMPGLKYQGVNYKLEAWCYNFVKESKDFDIISNVSSITWYQNDNNGLVVKVILGLSASLENSTRQIFSSVLTNLLSLEKLNRTLLSNQVDPNYTKNGVYETFYINRNFTVSYDLTAIDLINQLKNPSFKDSLNEALTSYQNTSISVYDVQYDTINSAYWDSDPTFKSTDFTRIFTADNTSATFFLEITNINGFIYMGFANETQTENLDWDHLVKGIDMKNNSLNGFEKVYVKMGSRYVWLWKGLEPNEVYTIYFGATNEKKFENALKTSIYRVVFKTKIE